MRCSPAAAAAELGQQRRRERKKTTERGRMKKDLKVVLIYKEKIDREGARNEEAENLITQRLRRLDFRNGY